MSKTHYMTSGKHIFDNVLGRNGLLRTKTRILVTNSISILPFVDRIVVLQDGLVSESGSYKELLGAGGAFAEFLMEHLQQQQVGHSPTVPGSMSLMCSLSKGKLLRSKL